MVLNEEILKLLRENNEMLKFIVACINRNNANADNENMNDFLMNVAANIISNKIGYNKY